MYFCSICVSCILGYKLYMICIADRNKDLFVCLILEFKSMEMGKNIFGDALCGK